ncbi:MAG: CoA transferase, partial [Myxococcales bacterium]|nr:CoA transferase [Myxococcales bacterium]
ERSTEEIVEAASLLRIPVAPVNSGATVADHEQLLARGALVADATGRFVQPRPPYRIDDRDPPPPRPAPRLGEHTNRIEPRECQRPRATGPAPLPLEGLRILDMTAWWAGPSATGMLAGLGADVIHLESITRLDGMRMVGGLLAGRHEAWWECSHFFLAANVNKRGLTLDLTKPRGLELARKLIAHCDAVIENFTPRVMENFGLTWETVHALNPQTILLRMPAFGLSGPWRNNTGCAQNMEQVTGLAWLTGHTDDQPRIQRGPCDPLAGMHAAFSLLVALAEREATGKGVHVECAMVEGALNAAAEPVIEFSAYGHLMHRCGNRSPTAAPQGLYPCRGSQPGRERWLALSVSSDAQWQAFKTVLGRRPGPMTRPSPPSRVAATPTIASMAPWHPGSPSATAKSWWTNSSPPESLRPRWRTPVSPVAIPSSSPAVSMRTRAIRSSVPIRSQRCPSAMRRSIAGSVSPRRPSANTTARSWVTCWVSTRPPSTPWLPTA